MKVISFSLWGTDPRYINGALANVSLAQRYYPDWELWVYCSTDVPAWGIDKLCTAGFKVHSRRQRFGPCDGLFWRFEPACLSEVEIFLSRDCDSRLNPREAAAVDEWLASGKRLHSMRDHHEHIVPILGGMWGCRYWPDFAKHMSAWTRRHQMGDDQWFLKDVIWPLVRDNDSVAHDKFLVDTTVDTSNGPFTYKPVEFFGNHDLRPFPPHEPLDPKIHGEHVGARVCL